MTVSYLHRMTSVHTKAPEPHSASSGGLLLTHKDFLSSRHPCSCEPASESEQSELQPAHHGDRFREATHGKHHRPQGAGVLLQELQSGLQRGGDPAPQPQLAAVLLSPQLIRLVHVTPACVCAPMNFTTHSLSLPKEVCPQIFSWCLYG